MSTNYGTFTTPAGTVLPLLNLKGKPYLQVAHRLVWFRELYPLGSVKTQLIEKFGEGAEAGVTFRAEVYVPLTGGQPGQMMLVATAHKSETLKDFRDYMEKAETAALGRALAMAGIGTQFCEPDMEEGDRLADSPVTPAKKSTSFRKPATGDDI